MGIFTFSLVAEVADGSSNVREVWKQSQVIFSQHQRGILRYISQMSIDVTIKSVGKKHLKDDFEMRVSK